MSQIQYDRAAEGRLVAWVFEKADRVLLRRCAELLPAELGAEAYERFDGGDQVFWDFVVIGSKITLQLSGSRLGVLANDASEHSDELVRRVAGHLELRIRP